MTSRRKAKKKFKKAREKFAAAALVANTLARMMMFANEARAGRNPFPSGGVISNAPKRALLEKGERIIRNLPM